MYLRIAQILSKEEVAVFQQRLLPADWGDGRATAGHLSTQVKQNSQLAEDHPLAIELGNAVLDRLDAHPRFVSAALPLKIAPPLFNRYRATERYGRHIDGAVRPVPGTPMRIRTDLSATLFLSEPDTYEGGELTIEDPAGEQLEFKLAAGDLLLYPASTVHQVAAVRTGTRLAAIFWLQSMVRSHAHREMLYNLDATILRLRGQYPDNPAIVDLTAHYHNLVREWADL